MKNNYLLPLLVAALVLAGGLLVSHAQQPAKPKDAGDARLDKIIQQNEQILKGQEEIKATLEKIRTELLQVRRQSG